MTRTKNTPPDTTSPRVRRGGSWYSGPSWVRAARRGAVMPAYRGRNFGFRTSLAGRMKR